jgi:hypothetical protein
LLAKPTPHNVNHDNDRFSMFNKKRDITEIDTGDGLTSCIEHKGFTCSVWVKSDGLFSGHSLVISLWKIGHEDVKFTAARAKLRRGEKPSIVHAAVCYHLNQKAAETMGITAIPVTLANALHSGMITKFGLHPTVETTANTMIAASQAV